ncbi:hypothetical protein [Streptomyces sp. NBC_01803]|uniref:hypothetical protein n=1 Tax=Streptomyces sp. NBC_01803 TaxID=2975946 RepID=UPI002DD80585|nr:hypothetical protein [Streptomyces sp. NBC_01803]WSA45958.1 hypothetical protein OIE51_18180 [Streptomyces sp. NBC_01803]
MAFLFFVFAQAAVTRSSGQSAADAAALAAARESRDHLFDEFLDAIDGDGDLEDVLEGDDFYVPEACAEAAPRLADRNDAVVRSCDPDHERTGYTVDVETRDTVGESLLPGTEDQTAHAEATAVIRSLCESESEEDDRVELRCDDDRDLAFDPGNEDELPEARDLFYIYLDD